MKTFHPLSFVLGLVSGLLILFVAVGGLKVLYPAGTGGPTGNRAAWQQRQGRGMGPNLSRMAEQLGMTEDELRTELQNGRNLRDIAAEKGVTLQFGNRARSGSGSVLSSSGSSVSAPTK